MPSLTKTDKKSRPILPGIHATNVKYFSVYSLALWAFKLLFEYLVLSGFRTLYTHS
jgi:hypothetical protein